MRKAIVLVSGGIDSSTVLAMVRKQGYQIHALSFYYSQRHSVELERIREFIKDYEVVEHRVVNIDLSVFGGSALTDSNIDVPKYQNPSDVGDIIPLTYVPARNTIFLSYALAFAEVIGAYDIFLGVHATDYANYPDCRPEYLKSFEDMANLATAAGVGGNKIKIHAPLINMTKTEIVKQGLDLGVNYAKTISCYDPSVDGKVCGSCHSCLIRRDAFKENGIKDPSL